MNNSITKHNALKIRFSQTLFQLISDSISLIISILILFLIRFYSGILSTDIQPGLLEFTLGYLFLWTYWGLIFFFSGLYKNWYLRSPFDEFWQILKSVFIGCGIIVFIIFTNSSSSPRMMFLLFFIIFSFTLMIGRFIIRRLELKLRQDKKIQNKTFLVGTSKRVFDFYMKNSNSPAWGFNIESIFLVDKINQTDLFKDIKVYSFKEEFSNIISNDKPEVVIISSDNTDHNILMEIVNLCAYNGIKVKVEPDLYDFFTGQTRAQNIYGIPLIEISTQLLKPWQALIKRVFDIIFSSLVILIGSPFWIVLGIMVKLDSKGPMFFTQNRVGLNGIPFKIYKFRSMVVNPGLTFTTVNDPRVTKFGRFIRKTHLDEVPQFLNVLIGDMSVVGPRPETEPNVKKFIEALPQYQRRLIIRPGITGWWQVKYKPHVLDLDEISNRLKDDFYYIENMSLQFDIEIVIRTVWAVLKGHGQA